MSGIKLFTKSDTENEKIFVVVPVYKVESYLERCIDSVLNQTYQNFELVLVDDGSPDNCPAICDRYAAEYDNITIIHQENVGLSAARNTGVSYVQEHGDKNKDWLTFVDSDDFVHPKYLEYLYQAVKDAGVKNSCCSFIKTVSSETEFPSAEFVYESLSPEDMWCHHYGEALVAWGKLYQLSLFTNISYPVGKINEDEFTTYKLLFQCTAAAFLPLKMYYYQNESSIMHASWSPRRLNGIEALHEQILFFSRNGYHQAVKITTFYLINRQIIELRAMEINHFEKFTRAALKKDLYSTLFSYG